MRPHRRATRNPRWGMWRRRRATRLRCRAIRRSRLLPATLKLPRPPWRLRLRATKPRLSQPHPTHKVYPYLLRSLSITRANQVWATDITYIPMPRGFAYLVAIMDWASRKTLSWRLSNTLAPSFCVEALEEGIAKLGMPEIFNTD